MKIYVSQIWDKDIATLTEGDVVRSDDGLVNLANLIQMRWGWPRTAARSAAYHLREIGEPTICVDSFGDSPSRRGARHAQQVKLFDDVPTLLADLCAGLVGRANADADVAHNSMDCVVVTLNNPIEEHGMVREIANAIAVRLGVPSDKVVDVIEIDRDTEPGLVSIRVKNKVDE